MNVPLMDLRSEHIALREELVEAWDEILDKAAFIGGYLVEQFENSFASYCEVEHAIGVGNGTDALTLALRALEIGAGDEVIVPANSFVATAEAVVNVGATPVFVDVHPLTYNIDVDQIEHCLTARTKAIIPVHLYGQPADMDPILDVAEAFRLRVIEDASQAHGARYYGRRVGSMGHVACFSFYPAKNLGACGDAGGVVTDDAAIAEAIRKLRDHGGLKKYQHDVAGYNSRLDSLQAAVLQVKLRRLDLRNAARRAHAELYNRILSGIEGIVTPHETDGIDSVYHLYVIRIENGSRDGLQQYLADRGIATGIHYPSPIHRTAAFAAYSTHCPVAERNADRILSLPMYPELDRERLEYVCSVVREYAMSHAEPVCMSEEGV
jgi:dTDP-4-amino-4,6-dideoxygalactose transaminase